MRIKIFTLITLLLILLGLMGTPEKAIEGGFLIIVPLMTYLFCKKLKLIPHNFYFSYRIILYFTWLIKEIMLSSIAVIKIIWCRGANIQPVFEWIEHEQANKINSVIYANSISITPGTITLDINNDMLLVHAIDQSSIDSLKFGSLSMCKRIKKFL